MDNAKPNNKDSPASKRQQELRAELTSIRQKQSGFKSGRTSTQEKINTLDATLKARIAEQNANRGRLSFKNVEELDKEIARLEKSVDSGTLRLVDERKALAEVSTLRKQRKSFAGLQDAQSGIDDIKAQISELRKTLDNPEAKALSDKYNEIQKELDALKAEQDGVFKNLNSLRDERTRLRADQVEKFNAIREIKDKYYKARRAYKEYEDEAWRVRRERQKAERDAFEREKRKKVADKKLEEASQLAYTDEILTAQGLIRHFDPAYNFSALGLDEKKDESSNFRAGVGRTVDAGEIKGMKAIRKDDEEDYFVGSGGKKGKKGGKKAPAAADSKFNMNVGIIEEFAKVKIDPPMNQSDVPASVEKLAAKITEWKKNQASKTQEVGRIFCLMLSVANNHCRTSTRPRRRLTVLRRRKLRSLNLTAEPPTLPRSPLSRIVLPRQRLSWHRSKMLWPMSRMNLRRLPLKRRHRPDVIISIHQRINVHEV